MHTESRQWLLQGPEGIPSTPVLAWAPEVSPHPLTSQPSISAVSPCPRKAGGPCLPCSWLGRWDGPWHLPKVQHFAQVFTEKILGVLESLLQELHLGHLHVCDHTEINVICQNSVQYAELCCLYLWRAFYRGLVQRNHPPCVFQHLVLAWFPGLLHCFLVMAAPVRAPQGSHSALLTMLLQTLPMFGWNAECWCFCCK